MGRKRDILYHYCSLETFEKIIKNKTIRFNDITKSNDSEELFYITELYQEFIGQQGFNSNLFLQKQDNEFNKTYCFCLSTLGDDLSQWRGYAPSGGVAIGFNVKKLKEFAHSIVNECSLRAEVNKVVYLNKDSSSKKYYKNKLGDFFSKIRQDFEMQMKNGLSATLPITEITKIAHKYKNDCFECEKEWRISFTCRDNEHEESKINVCNETIYKEGNSFYIPFHLNMIEEIIIGPKVSFLGQVKQLPEIFYDFLKENDMESSEDDKYNLSIKKENIKLTKLSYR